MSATLERPLSSCSPPPCRPLFFPQAAFRTHKLIARLGKKHAIQKRKNPRQALPQKLVFTHAAGKISPVSMALILKPAWGTRMPSSASVTHWVQLLKGGDATAARLLWEKYFPRLVLRVRSVLRGKPPVGADE